MTATAPARVARSADAPPYLLHLRPVAHASPTADGVHVRGWTSSFSVSGGTGVWRIWRRLAAALTDGATASSLSELSDNPQVRRVIDVLLHQLRDHDLLVELPACWGAGLPDRTVRWLYSAADDPAGAAQRLAQTRVVVYGDGLVAAAASRALAAHGVEQSVTPSRGPTVVRAGTVAVAAQCDDRRGYVSAPADSATARRHAGSLAARLALGAAVEPVLAALVGSAAVHRLLCAVGGLADPADPDRASESAGLRTPPGFEPVLVARADPLGADYHAWSCGRLSSGATGTSRLADSLAAVDALCDPELGTMPPAAVTDLPQLPAGLAAVTTADGTSYGVAATPEVARLVAVLGGIEQRVRRGAPGVSVGADDLHATGLVLRQCALARPAAGPVVTDDVWAGQPMARLWWKALVLRFGIAATVHVRMLGDGVFRADVTEDGRLRASAVEATPGDAVAFAALAAVGTAQWLHAGRAADARVFAACGATPVARPEPSDAARWQYGPWTWPADAAAAEPALQHRLRALVGAAAEIVHDLPAQLCDVLPACRIARLRR